MNNSAKYQLYPSIASERLIFFNICSQLLIAMSTDQIERFGLK